MLYSVACSLAKGKDYVTPLKGDFIECMDRAKELGYDGIEIHLRSPEDYDIKKLAKHARETGMKITGMATGMATHFDGIYMTHKDPDIRKAAQQRLIDFARAGAEMDGAVVLFGLMKGPLPEPCLREQYKSICFESLQPVVDEAEKLGVEVSIEGVNRFQAAYLWSTPETLEFVNRFHQKNVTIHLDCFHMNIEDSDIYEAIRMSKDKLGYFHFTDNDRWYPGHGHIDFPGIVKTLNEIGYLDKGVGGFEYDSYPSEEESATLGREYIKGLIDAL